MDAFFVFITRDEGLRLPMVALWLLLLAGCGPRWRRRALWLVPLVAISDSLTSHVLKELFARSRPCHEELAGLRLLVDCGPGFSFPSTHAANMGAAGVFLMRGVRRWRRRPAVLVLPVLVAYSRVHVGVHWPLDVLAGFATGTLLALAAEAGLRRLPWRRLRLTPPPGSGT
ncbi:MAG: phosphatase PAP2 family protein [Candidatus Krumholzibacteriota bacterium]|nr:phosphatase PAP2 family protein [Candidatus Krumholzibacteriota bacterium]